MPEGQGYDITIILMCQGCSHDAIVMVRNGGSGVTLRSPTVCDDDHSRITLALQHGFSTHTEREYARLHSLTYHPRTRVRDACWIVRFDMSDALAHL